MRVDEETERVSRRGATPLSRTTIIKAKTIIIEAAVAAVAEERENQQRTPRTPAERVEENK